MTEVCLQSAIDCGYSLRMTVSVICKQLLLFLRSLRLFEELHFEESEENSRNFRAIEKALLSMAFLYPLRLRCVVFFSYKSCYLLFFYFGSHFNESIHQRTQG